MRDDSSRKNRKWLVGDGNFTDKLALYQTKRSPGEEFWSQIRVCFGTKSETPEFNASGIANYCAKSNFDVVSSVDRVAPALSSREIAEAMHSKI